MDGYASTITFADAAERVRAARRIALVTHARPDGDAMGSVLALHRALAGPDHDVEIFLMGPIEAPLRALAEPTPYATVDDAPPAGEPDLVIVLDTGAWGQVEPIGAWLAARREKTMVIDHHPNGDVDMSDARLIDPDAAAAAEMVARLLDELGCELTTSVAEALFVGIATDTGWFRFANAKSETFALAARLLERGVDKTGLYRRLEETFPVERLALEARALASLEMAADGTAAIQSLSADDFVETGCTVEHLTGMVNRPMIVDGVQVSILLAETIRGCTKVSLRGKPTEPGRSGADVSGLARKLGGGGHVFAAGARLDVGLEEARRKVRDALGER